MKILQQKYFMVYNLSAFEINGRNNGFMDYQKARIISNFYVENLTKKQNHVF